MATPPKDAGEKKRRAKTAEELTTNSKTAKMTPNAPTAEEITELEAKYVCVCVLECRFCYFYFLVRLLTAMASKPLFK